MRRQLIRRLATTMMACTLLAGPVFTAQPDEVLDTVLVTGEHPGPGLWKVSKDDHVMWVFATHRPLPKGMTWRAKQVEARIAESQEVLLAGNAGVRPKIGTLQAITLIPAARGTGKNPDGATLKQVLPPETYARWLVLREKYVGKDDDIEEWRPVVALSQLQRKAREKHGLQDGSNPQSVVRAVANRHDVRIHKLKDVVRVVRVEDLRGMLKASRKEEAPDLACFTRDLDELESGIERAKARANAWARGDIARLRELQQRKWQLGDDCGYLRFAAPGVIAVIAEDKSSDDGRVTKLIADAMWHAQWAAVQAQQEWVAAAQAALAKNPSTFAVLPLEDVLRADGHLAALRSLGYTVEEPL